MADAVHPQIVCVLGMHRSGTSCLTGLLQQRGLSLGKHHQWNRFNQKGSRENQDFVDLNEQLLADNDGSWMQPPKRLAWEARHEQAARTLVDSFPKDLSWGFKDPRSLLLLDFWEAQIRQLRYVGVFRHPAAVAKSLRRRSAGKLDEPRAMALWCRYNQILYDLYQREPFPLLCFDWDAQQFTRRAAAAAKSLGLRGTPTGECFYDGRLIHYQGSDATPAPREPLALYRKLRDLSASQ